MLYSSNHQQRRGATFWNYTQHAHMCHVLSQARQKNMLTSSKITHSARFWKCCCHCLLTRVYCVHSRTSSLASIIGRWHQDSMSIPRIFCTTSLGNCGSWPCASACVHPQISANRLDYAKYQRLIFCRRFSAEKLLYIFS